MPLEVSRDVRNVSRWGGQLGLSLGSPQEIQTSLHLVRWKMSLHVSHCREIWPSFESEHLGVHSTWVCSAHSEHLSTYDGHLRNVIRLGREIRMPLEVKQNIKPPFLVGTVILGFLSIFKKRQASSPFETFNSTCLSKCQGMWGHCPDDAGN